MGALQAQQTAQDNLQLMLQLLVAQTATTEPVQAPMQWQQWAAVIHRRSRLHHHPGHRVPF
jgi:hypothetical protein